MPKKIRKFKKRKFMRKRFRKFKYKKGTKQKVFSTPFMKSMKVKMFTRSPPTYIDKGTINLSGNEYIMLNRLAPYHWVSTLNPQYHEQLVQIYRSYRVYGVKYKLTFTLGPSALTDDTHSRGVAILVAPHDAASIFGLTNPSMIPKENFYKAGQNPGCQLKQLHFHPDKPSTVSFKGYVDFKKVFGKETITDVNFLGTNVANPLSTVYLNIYTTALHDLDSINAFAVEMCVSMTQYVRYTERDTGLFDA